MTIDQKINAINALNGTITAFAIINPHCIEMDAVKNEIMDMVKTIDEPEKFRVTPEMLGYRDKRDNTNK